MNLIKNASLRVKLQLLTLLCATGLVALAYTAFMALEPNVENTAYHHILEGKDALADVLPPPMFLVEAYAICHQLPDTDDPTELRRLEAALAKWKVDYHARASFWQTELPAGPLRDTMTRELGEPVDEFFSIVEREFLPAVHSRNEEKCASLLMGSMLQAYSKQHAVVDRVVSLATTYVDESAAEAAADIKGHRAEVLVLLAALLVGSILFSLWLTASITGPVGRCKTALEAVAAGDLTGQVEVSSRDEVGQMTMSLNQAVQNMRNTLHDVRQSADSAAGASKQLSAAAEDISAGAQEQASGLEETAASLEEMTTTVRQNAENAQQAKQVAVGAREVADKGGQVVSRAVTAMTEINDSSRRIAAIITTIDEIAFQTNLLALNAAVEAARAGEQGRGFSVVAAEVRSLAQRSASAAKEIKQLIEDSVNKVDNGTNLVNESGRALQEIVTSVKRVTDIVGEIAAASAEQSQGIDQVNKAVNQMDQVTQANAAQTEELSGTSVALATQAEHLQQLVANFRLDGGGSAGLQRPAATAAPSAPLARVLPFRQKQHTRAAAAAPVRASMAKAVGDDSAGDDFDKAFEEF